MNFLNLTKLNKDDLSRFKTIFTVLMEYGFEEVVKKLPIPKKLFIFSKIQKKNMDEPPAKRLRIALEELGTAFIKLGQFASTRPDLIPAEYIKELTKLQEEVTPVGFDEIKTVPEGIWGKDWISKFKEFNRNPAATASTAQVYRAVMSSGVNVAVKIQKPGIKEEIHSDLKLINWIAELLEKYVEESRLFQPIKLVEKFSIALERELDYKREAYLIEKFNKNHSDIDSVYIPKVDMELTNEKILVMEFIEGKSIAKCELSTEKKKEFSSLIVNTMARQVLRDGLFHADPHPGNVICTDDGKIAFLDFGMIGRLSPDMREHLLDLLIAVKSDNPKLMLQEVLIMGKVNPDVDLENLMNELMEITERFKSVPLKDIYVGRLLMDIFSLIRKNRIKVNPVYSMIAKAILTAEETAKLLNEEIDVIADISPLLKKMVLKKYSPETIIDKAKLFGKELSRLIETVPAQTRNILSKLQSGELEIEFRHVGLEKLINSMDKVSNRLTFGMIIGSLIIGSSIVLVIDKGPKVYDISLFGIVGYLLASIIGMWLIVSIIKSGKL